MSVVIIGGNERMERKYTDICACFGHKAKVFTKESGSVAKKLGKADLLIIFTGTVSHKMMISAVDEARRLGTRIARCQSGSATALQNLLAEHA